MTKKQKKKKYLSILKACLLASTSLIYFTLAYIGYQQNSTNLNDVSKTTGVVVERRLVVKQRKGRRAGTTSDFILMIQGSDHPFVFSNKSDLKYSLAEKLPIGDSVAIYHKNKNIIQLEKNSKILISLEDYQSNSWFLITIGLIAGLGTLVVVTIGYKKGKF